MNKIEVINNGAALIRNGVIEEVGPAPRVENLAPARRAMEINATGKVVMPAFVDADATVLHDGACGGAENMPQTLRTSSRRKLTWAGVASTSEYARYGTLTAGVPALFAEDLKNLLKLLTAQQSLQTKPMRLRSIVCPCLSFRDEAMNIEQIASKWLTVVKERRLASILELTSSADQDGALVAAIRAIALASAAAGFALRVRSLDGLPAATVELARIAGAIAILTPPCAELLRLPDLVRSGIVFTIAADALDEIGRLGNRSVDPRTVRSLIDCESAVALTMGSATSGYFTRNMQHALYLACRDFKMTPEEAITATTINAAHSLRTAHVTGSLEPGKTADLLVMDVPDFRELVRRPGMSNVELAMRNGQIVYRRTPLILD